MNVDCECGLFHSLTTVNLDLHSPTMFCTVTDINFVFLILNKFYVECMCFRSYSEMWTTESVCVDNNITL